jgi:tRNA threonylcarbamoyladenosine biosynthesis protein TsaB
VTVDGEVVAEDVATASRSHVGHLPRLVAGVLRAAGLGLGDLDGMAVSAGPGSFTGLRIGVAFAKGLAFAAARPLAGVSTLEAHAIAARRPVGSLVCVANDARKGEVYAAIFVVDSPTRVTRRSEDRAWSPAALCDALPAASVVVGDGVPVLQAEGRSVRVGEVVPSGGVVAQLGAAAIARGATVDLIDFEPTYVRVPDATLPETPLR